MNYFCCTETRRNDVKLHPVLNGIDYLEVEDNPSDPYNIRQTKLFLHFLKPVLPGGLDKDNFIIEKGVRIKDIEIIGINYPGSDSPEVTEVIVSKSGDFSVYTLRLIDKENKVFPPEGFDPALSSIEFSFKAACTNDFDCKPYRTCYKTPTVPPEINYLSKDYATFRQLMLDRMSLLIPGWNERNPSDLGIVLVELLAYVADQLSYQQDAIATEAYLGTARKRISVRRHARLVDYFMHDGCNSRTWLHIETGEKVSGLCLKKGEGSNTTKILTRLEGFPLLMRPDSNEYRMALSKGSKVFELMHDIILYSDHNVMYFHTWGGRKCCLPKGATSATLQRDLSNLNPGDVLILCEVLNPATGTPENINPAHRHAVRLKEVHLSYDINYQSVTSPPGSPFSYEKIPVTEIAWNESDALPFALCISSLEGTENISVAMGNNVLADHGLTVEDEKGESSVLPPDVPASKMYYACSSSSENCDFCEPLEKEPVPVRYNPKLILTEGWLTHFAPIDFSDENQSAGSFINWSMRDCLPSITLTESHAEESGEELPIWYPVHDLLNSSPFSKEFVVETESDGTIYMRFGDDKLGKRPVEGTTFHAKYRTGNGVSGNIGAESLAHLVTNDADIIAGIGDKGSVRNPFPATGGTEPETIEEVKQFAPVAFRKQERAVTPEDFDELSKRVRSDIQRSATTLRWTGSWRTFFLTVDRLGGLDVSKEFEKDLRSRLERYRMAGYDLEVDSPPEISLEMKMEVCVNKNFFAVDVKEALLEIFSNRILVDGRRGVFHPDNFSFGQTVYLSTFYNAAQSVEGVESVNITTFKRQYDTDNSAIETGKLLMGRREIARLDNDPNFSDHGILNLIMKGGR